MSLSLWGGSCLPSLDHVEFDEEEPLLCERQAFRTLSNNENTSGTAREEKLQKTCDGLQKQLTNLRNAKEQMVHKHREHMANALATKDAELQKKRMEMRTAEWNVLVEKDRLEGANGKLTAKLQRKTEEAAMHLGRSIIFYCIV